MAPFRPENVLDIVSLDDPTIGPDGSSVIYVRTIVERAEMESRSSLVRQAVPDGNPESFTAGPNDGHPRFSPDGSTIAFLRPGEAHGTQIWLIPLDGGEAKQLTGLPGGVQDFAWSPDGGKLVVVSKVDPDLPNGEETVGPRSLVARRIRYRDDGSGWRGDAFSRLFVVEVETGAHRQLTKGDGNQIAPAWSPDGTRIAFVSDAVAERDVSKRSEVHVMPLGDGAAVCWSEGLSRANELAWSPDGKRLAAVGSHDEDVWDGRQSWLYVLQEDAAARCVSDDVHTVVEIDRRSWVAEDRILFVGEHAGVSALCRASAAGGPVETAAAWEGTFTALAIDEGRECAIVNAATDRAPEEIATVDLADGGVTVRTSFNASILQQYPPAVVEKFTFERAGETIEARVLFPPGFDPSERWPLILDIHGGPNGRFADVYSGTLQVLAGFGAIVLTVNPRGSSSYGPDFMKAVLRDWGGEDYLDLMKAVDLMCERPYVDSERLGVHGSSYGGFMTCWIIGQDHRFKAAVSSAPVTNLYSFWGTSDIGVHFGENQFGGSALDPPEVLFDRSPIRYASEVQTPVLLLCGEEDYRCPIEQTEQYFTAIKRQGKEVEFVRFPGESHGLRASGHPKFRVEYHQRTVDWFAKYMGSAD